MSHQPPPFEELPQEKARPARATILFLMTTVFLNVLGMTIVFPVLPFVVEHYLREPSQLAWYVGWLQASYAICQFIAAPGLGILSDRYGRRPILFSCMFGTMLGFVLFGIGGALWVLFLGRIIDGLTGGDNSVLFAYLADISSPEERGKLFGRIGGLIGVSFIIGPAIGGFVAMWGYSTPLYLAAAIFLVTIVWGLFVMPESLPPHKRVKRIKVADLNPFAQIGNVFTITRLRWLIVASLCHGFPFAMFTTLLTVLLFDTLHWQPGTIGLVLLVNGSIDIIMQGVVSERLIARWGEVRLTIAGLVGLALSFGLVGVVAIVPEPRIVFVGIACFAISSGLLEPSLRALIANATPDEAQGTVQGSTTALLAATNIAAPIIAGTLYTQFGGETPYWLGAVILLVGIVMMRLASRHLDLRPAVAPIEPKMS